MKVRRVSVGNFRGVRFGSVTLDGHSLLVGGNVVGKSTICEALDLALGLERLYRRPVIDEFDFYQAAYRDDAQTQPPSVPVVRIEVVLTELSQDAQRRFHGHLRPWSADTNDFAAPVDDDAIELADGEWCLPIVFLGRFNPDEDDFEGNTFFGHPQRSPGEYDERDLGGGLAVFRRDDKRYCGFLYLRPNRTGARALSFGRGSLIDTIVRLESGEGGSLWENALDELRHIDLADSTAGFTQIRNQLLSRVRRFLSMADDDSGVGVRPSDLTREHLREVLRMFIATQPGTYPVPFNRLSTGALNVLVFALLTYIADLRGPGSVIFAMEEPEIALPPHTQRRLVDFVTANMGQAIVTSHSPYVIEKFDPDQIVVLNRDHTGALTSNHIDLGEDVKPKRYRAQRRQFAEAVLARAVLVVEGATEVATYLAVADVLDADPDTAYQHPDVAGLSLFNAENDVSVPVYGEVFAGLGKIVFGAHDTPDTPFSAELAEKTKSFTIHRDIAYAGIEELLVTEIDPGVLRRFLTKVAAGSDYPQHCGYLPDPATDADVVNLARKVLRARKGAESLAPQLIAECSREELPATLADLLLEIHAYLSAAPPDLDPTSGAEKPATGGTDSLAGNSETAADDPGAA